MQINPPVPSVRRLLVPICRCTHTHTHTHGTITVTLVLTRRGLTIIDKQTCNMQVWKCHNSIHYYCWCHPCIKLYCTVGIPFCYTQHSHISVTNVAVAVLDDMFVLGGVKDKPSSSSTKLPAHVGVSGIDSGSDNTSTHMDNENQSR